jgi:ABC-type spermidine/putrescine transport system permease subunit I
LNNGIEIVALFFLILAAVGTVEFAIHATIVIRAAYQAGLEGEFAEFGEVLNSWLSNVVIHLTIDTVATAFITAILSFVFGEKR